MYKSYIFIILLFVLGIILEKFKKEKYSTNNYIALKKPLTETEIKFCNELRKITDKYNFIIIPQLQLQRIFKTFNKNDIKLFNKIKSKSIDFAIVDKEYNYKFFIELDDYSHNRKSRIKRDNFVNELFSSFEYKLLRIKVKNSYNLEEIEKEILKNEKIESR